MAGSRPVTTIEVLFIYKMLLHYIVKFSRRGKQCFLLFTPYPSVDKWSLFLFIFFKVARFRNFEAPSSVGTVEDSARKIPTGPDPLHHNNNPFEP